VRPPDGHTGAVAPWVLHVDLDQFLAAVEVLRRPELAGRPVVVGGTGDPTQRAVVATASYEARRHGVRSGMPLRTAARRCPDAVFLPADNAHYEQVSEQVMTALRELPGVVVEVLGWDEAFLGPSAGVEAGPATDDPGSLAQRVRAAVRERTRLACSVGIGDNLLRAKLATGFAKPGSTEPGGGRGVYRLTAANWAEVMFDRPVQALWGIGTRTARKLADRGVSTVRDLAVADPAALAAELGPAMGPWYVQLGRGLGRVVVEPAPWVPRSRSHETTFQTDLADWADVRSEVAALARRVAADFRAGERPAARVAVKVRYVPFRTATRSATLPAPTTDADRFVAAALDVLDRFPSRRPVRLLGVRADFAAETP
jgi:DNA polymerase IV